MLRSRWTALLPLALPALAPAQFAGGGLPDLSGASAAISGAVAPKPSGTFSTGLAVPSVDPGATARSIGRELRTSVEAKTGAKNPGLQALEDGMPKALAQMETQLQGLGFAKRDLGVAMGYFFVTNYETATGRTVPQAASLAAGRTVARATAQRWRARFDALPPRGKEALYERLIATPMLLNALADQFQKAGKAADARSLRGAAGAMFKSVVGTDPSAVTIDATGRISGLAGGASAPSSSARRPVGHLAAAGSLNAQVFVMYVTPLQGQSPIQELILFPDGTAVDEVPGKPVARFDAAGLRNAVRPVYFGRWRRSGNRLTVQIGRNTDVYVKDPSGGWADPHLKSGSFGIYFPVEPASPALLAGRWKSQSLSTVGTPGGSFTAGGREQEVEFRPDGTFVGNARGFATSNDSEGSVTVSGGRGTASGGRWRLDGLLLGTDGGVRLAYVLPHWGSAGEPPEVMIGGDRWSRPGRG